MNRPSIELAEKTECAPAKRQRPSRYELAALALIVLVGAFLRLNALDFAQFRADDVTLWNIARDFIRNPHILTRGMHSSFGLSNGPFQAYLLLPGALATASPIGSYITVAVLNVIGIVLCWAFVREYWGPRVALVTALLFAVNPWAVVFSRRLWGNDMVAPVTVLLIWSLCDLARHGRRRDSLLPLLWLSIAVQLYVVALVQVLVAALGLVAARNRLRWRFVALGLAVSGLISAPYVLRTVLPEIGNLTTLLSGSGGPAVFDGTSTSFMLQIVNGVGYQAFANQAGRFVDAGKGIPGLVGALSEGLLALGIVYAAVASVRLRRNLGQGLPYLLPLVAMVLPALLLVRHSTPVYPYYLLTGLPMHFLLMALGLRVVWRALGLLVDRWAKPFAWVPTATVATVVIATVATHLFLAQAFYTAIREYWPKSDYGLPLHYTLEIAETAKRLVTSEDLSRAYIGGSEERDSVLYRALKPELPTLSFFNSADTFVMPEAGTGTALYILSSKEDRVGAAFAQSPSIGERAAIEVPGSGLRYSFATVGTEEVAGKFAQAGSTPLGVTFDGRARIESFAVGRELQPGVPHELALRWTLLEGTSPGLPSYFAYVRLIDKLKGAHGGANYPFYDPAQWQAGEQVLWWRELPTPSGLDAGGYSYLVGLYTVSSATTYRNAPAVDRNGTPIGDGVALGAMVVQGPAAPPPQTRLQVDFERKVALEGYDSKGLVAGKPWEIDLHWKTLEQLDEDYSVFVHLIGPDGKMVAQHDAQPKLGRFPTSAWIPGEVVVDQHTLDIPASLARGRYSVAAGLYYLPTGARLGGEGFSATFPLVVE